MFLSRKSLWTLSIIALILVGTTHAGLEESEAWLEENSKKDGVVTLPSGLQYKVLKVGKGEDHPEPHQPCDIHFIGKLIDGTELDNSYKRRTPSQFVPNMVIDGWAEALSLMKEGDKWELYVPSNLAYGELGKKPDIGPDEALFFSVELILIKEPKGTLTKECAPKTPQYCDKVDIKIIKSLKLLDLEEAYVEMENIAIKKHTQAMGNSTKKYFERRVKYLEILIKDYEIENQKKQELEDRKFYLDL